MEAPGGYGKSYHQTFHDPCKVRAVVFDDGKRRVALVGIDLLFVTRSLVQEARAEIGDDRACRPYLEGTFTIVTDDEVCLPSELHLTRLCAERRGVAQPARCVEDHA